MADPSNIRIIEAAWTGDLRFEGGEPGGPRILIDADNATSPGPMLTLLLAAASCTGADIVSILKKMQIDLARCDVKATGERAPDHPRRYLKLHFEWTLTGGGLTEAKARRAIELSIEKYCSVLHTLNPDIPVSYDLHLE
jgi:putative redox protein